MTILIRTHEYSKTRGFQFALDHKAGEGYRLTISNCSIVGHLAIVSLRGDHYQKIIVPSPRQSSKNKDAAIAFLEKEYQRIAAAYPHEGETNHG